MKHQAANKISEIKRGSDILKEDNDIAEEAIRYFSFILTKDLSLNMEDQNEVVQSIPKVISNAQNWALLAIPKIMKLER